MKDALDSTRSRVHHMEDRNSELKDRMIEEEEKGEPFFFFKWSNSTRAIWLH